MKNEAGDSAIGFVLDHLRDGPVRLADLYMEGWKKFGFTHEDIGGAARHLGIMMKKLDGVAYVMRPHNLVAIWWAQRPNTHQWTGAATGGNAA